MSTHVCRHSDVERIYGDESFRVMEMYGFSPTAIHCDCYSPPLSTASYNTTHTVHSIHNTHQHSVPTMDRTHSMNHAYSTQSHSMPLLPTWLVQKLRGEFEKNEAMPAHNPSVFASPSNPPTSQQPTQPIDNIAAAPIVPIPPPVVQQPDDSDEIPAEVIEASRRSLLEDELERTKRDNEMQQKYIHDVEIALQESVQSIVNTVSKIANTVVDGVVGLVSSQNKQESAQNTQVTADNIQNTKPDTVNDSCIHTTSVPLVSDSAVIPAVPIQPQQAAPVQPQQNNPECMICFDDECGAVNTVFIPCGHTCCEKCSSAVEICPKCNAPITSRNRFFL